MRRLQTALLGAAGVLLPLAGSASLIVNGDFSGGNTGFTSDYSYVATPQRSGPGGSWVEGTYAIDTNPNNCHSLWYSFGDHTTGNGLMMIVNGSPTAGQAIWKETVALTAGTYLYSAWVANTYPDNPANVQLTLNGSPAVTFNPTGVGVWQELTYMFTVASAETFTIVDLNLARSGNDFALDDISLVAVPEPTTMIAGALLLLPFGLSTVRLLRRRV